MSLVPKLELRNEGCLDRKFKNTLQPRYVRLGSMPL